MEELPSRESLEMFLLLLTLISTALAMPAHDCPPFPPADICIAEGEECHTSVHMSSIPTADLSCPTVLDPSTQTAARPLWIVSWWIGLRVSSALPLLWLQQKVACLGHPQTAQKAILKAVLVTSTTRGDARCLTSALLRETNAHTSVHWPSTPTADLSCPTVLDPSTKWAARPL